MYSVCPSYQKFNLPNEVFRLWRPYWRTPNEGSPAKDTSYAFLSATDAVADDDGGGRGGGGGGGNMRIGESA